MNQTISTLSRQTDSLQSLGAIIALSAPANHGKTSTLLHLAEQLATHGKNKVYCERFCVNMQICVLKNSIFHSNSCILSDKGFKIDINQASLYVHSIGKNGYYNYSIS